MTNVIKVKVVVSEDEVEKKSMEIGYFEGQPYEVKIDTPDGVDREYGTRAGDSDDPDAPLPGSTIS